ncbi:hypothetical protein M514_16405 [Trichuris suis]|uniref:Uncharacterized protein n=1 Tax=Trichuris suis TaxID=68888 RepID=A0A085NPS7_9BILA|nr:hypothetical protein M514_16405 [Trichuris suis]
MLLKITDANLLPKGFYEQIFPFVRSQGSFEIISNNKPTCTEEGKTLPIQPTSEQANVGTAVRQLEAHLSFEVSIISQAL